VGICLGNALSLTGKSLHSNVHAWHFLQEKAVILLHADQAIWACAAVMCCRTIAATHPPAGLSASCAATKGCRVAEACRCSVGLCLGHALPYRCILDYQRGHVLGACAAESFLTAAFGTPCTNCMTNLQQTDACRTVSADPVLAVMRCRQQASTGK
jgi:hypothetical protein